MRVAGLSGGIATGKSSVTRLCREQGVLVIDCDEIARDVVKQVRTRRLQRSWPFCTLTSRAGQQRLQAGGGPVWQRGPPARRWASARAGTGCPPAVRAAGATSVSAGQLDRKGLGQLVFQADPRKRKQLNAALHPLITLQLVWRILCAWLRHRLLVVCGRSPKAVLSAREALSSSCAGGGHAAAV